MSDPWPDYEACHSGGLWINFDNLGFFNMHTPLISLRDKQEQYLWQALCHFWSRQWPALSDWQAPLCWLWMTAPGFYLFFILEILWAPFFEPGYKFMFLYCYCCILYMLLFFIYFLIGGGGGYLSVPGAYCQAVSKQLLLRLAVRFT